MNVVPIILKTPGSLRSWSPNELETLISIYESHAARGHASGWDVGATELDDPQFYILGAALEPDCIIAISRVGRIYVLENGTGQVLGEGASLETIAARAKMPIGRRRLASLVARMVLAVTTVRLTIEEKVEPLLLETEELLVRFAPQLAAIV